MSAAVCAVLSQAFWGTVQTDHPGPPSDVHSTQEALPGELINAERKCCPGRVGQPSVLG